ncbi:MAG: hypothetical protein CMH56_08225 [Myxococcales bacterium]|nr:hypothetical protein [Myxococcales bacterium]
MAKDPELKDAGETLAHQLRQGGLREASRYVMQAVREANISAMREAALRRLVDFPKKNDGAAFRPPASSKAAQDYLKDVASERLSTLVEAQQDHAAPAPMDFTDPNDTIPPGISTEAVLISNESEPLIEHISQPPMPAPIPINFLDAAAPANENEFVTQEGEPELEHDSSDAQSLPPELTQEDEPLVSATIPNPRSEDDEFIEEEHPHTLPFFDGVDRVFFGSDESIAYFVQRLYLRNLMPFDCASPPEQGKELSITLINQNNMSNMVDVIVELTEAGKGVFVFESLKEVETEARTLCSDMAWSRTQVALARAPREIRPPELRSKETLYFWHVDDFKKIQDELASMSALMLTSQQDLPMAFETEAIFQISGTQFNPIPAHIQPMGRGQLVANFPDQAALDAALEEINEAISRETIVEDKKTAGLSLAGTLCIPNSAAELLDQNFENQPTIGDLNQPSAIILLRVLTGAEGICEVILKLRDGQTRNFFVQEGITLFSRFDVGQLAQYLSEPGTVYAIIERPKIPPALSKIHIVKLLSAATRLLLSHYEEEDLNEAMTSRFDLAPKLTSLGEKRVHVLGLPKLLERHVTFKYNGQEVGRNLLLVEGDRKSGLEAMALLEMHNFLDWEAPTLSLKDRVETLVDHFERIEEANPFETLELHWFCSPIEIIESYHEHRQLFGPQGKRRNEAPEWADKIWEKVESAFRFIDDKKSRDLYRKEHHDKKSRKDMATHLIKQARMDMFRDEDFAAQRKLDAAMDIYPNSAAQALLDQLSGKSERG